MTCSFMRRAGTFKIMANITSCTMPTKGTFAATGSIVLVGVALGSVALVGALGGVALVGAIGGVALVSVALVGALGGVALVGVALVGVGSDAAISAGVGFGTEIPITALAVKWVLFAA